MLNIYKTVANRAVRRIHNSRKYHFELYETNILYIYRTIEIYNIYYIKHIYNNKKQLKTFIKFYDNVICTYLYKSSNKCTWHCFCCCNE